MEVRNTDTTLFFTGDPVKTRIPLENALNITKPNYLVCYLYDQKEKPNPLKSFQPHFFEGYASVAFDWTTIFYLPKGKGKSKSFNRIEYLNKTTIHVDYPRVHNWFYQIRGQKRIVVMPETPASLQLADAGTQTLLSGENRLAEFVKYRAQTAILSEGDLIVFPSTWPHEFWALDDNNISWTNTAFTLFDILHVENSKAFVKEISETVEFWSNKENFYTCLKKMIQGKELETQDNASLWPRSIFANLSVLFEKWNHNLQRRDGAENFKFAVKRWMEWISLAQKEILEEEEETKKETKPLKKERKKRKRNEKK